MITLKLLTYGQFGGSKMATKATTKTEEKKTTAATATKTAAEVKTAAKADVKKVEETVKAAAPKKEEAPKKTATAKTTTKKAATSKSSSSLTVQFAGKDIDTAQLQKEIVEKYVEQTGNKTSAIKDLKIYIKPADNRAYYVVNPGEGEYVSSVEL